MTESFFNIGGSEVPISAIANMLGSAMNYQHAEVPTVDSINPGQTASGAPSYSGISTFVQDSYNMPEGADMSAENTANTLNMGMQGAKIGAAFGGIGAPVGAAVGALGGFVLGKVRKNKQEDRLEKARKEAIDKSLKMQGSFNEANVSHYVNKNAGDRMKTIQSRRRFPTVIQ